MKLLKHIQIKNNNNRFFHSKVDLSHIKINKIGFHCLILFFIKKHVLGQFNFFLIKLFTVSLEFHCHLIFVSPFIAQFS